MLAQRVRTNFWAQNLELNFLRLPLYTGGCGCDDCCAPAFTLTGLCGVRYFRMDDDFEFGTEWDDGSGPFNGFDHNSANELYHDIQMENNLVGFQLGANMNYCVAVAVGMSSGTRTSACTITTSPTINVSTTAWGCR